ncbi:MAG: hypothetical protein ACLGHN_05840 [Bacteriovoracia bacterium]
MATYMEDNQLSRYNLTSKVLVYGGATGGMVAGLTMAIVSMLMNAFAGAGFFAPVKLIAVTFLGPDAVDGGVFSILIGLVIHLFNSAILGIIFAYIAKNIHSRGAFMATGVLFGIVVWVVMTYLVLPVANEVMLNQVNQTPVRWFVNHIIFGLALSIVPYFERRKATKAAF